MADLKFLGSVQLLDPFIHLISMILVIQNIHPFKWTRKKGNKLGLSCAKLRTRLAS